MTHTPQDLLTVPEVAEALRISTMTVRRHIASGALQSLRVGRQYRVPRAALGALAAKETQETQPMIHPMHTPKLTEMPPDQIAALIRENEDEARRDREEHAASLRAIEAARVGRVQAIFSRRKELARDLGCLPDGLATALAIKLHSSTPLVREIIARLVSDDHDTIDFDTIDGARHALAHTGELPPVRRDAKSFSPAKALRDMPFPIIEPCPMIDEMRLGPITSSLGIAMPELVEPDCEHPNDAWDRTQRLHDAGAYDRKDEARSAAIREQDLTHSTRRWRDAKKQARTEYLDALRDLRTRLRDAIDVELAKHEIDPAWVAAREVRRHVAGEPRPFTSDIKTTWHTAITLGFRVALPAT